MLLLPNHKHVHSSRIISIAHDGITNTLEVIFKGGAAYRYTPVSDTKYNNLLHSVSIGSDMQAIINDKTIVCTKIMPPPTQQSEGGVAPVRENKPE